MDACSNRGKHRGRSWADVKDLRRRSYWTESWSISNRSQATGKNCVLASWNCTMAFPLSTLLYEYFVTLVFKHTFLCATEFMQLVSEVLPEITMMFLLDCLQQERLIRKFTKFCLCSSYDLVYVSEVKNFLVIIVIVVLRYIVENSLSWRVLVYMCFCVSDTENYSWVMCVFLKSCVGILSNLSEYDFCRD